MIKTAFDAVVGSDTFKALTTAWDSMTAGLVGPSDLWAWLTGQVEAPFSWLTTAWDSMTAGLVGPSDLWAWLTGQVEAPFSWLTTAWDSMTAVRLGTGPSDLWAWLAHGTGRGSVLVADHRMGFDARVAQGAG